MTSLDAFIEARAATWAELDELVTRAGRRPARLGPDGVRRLADLYRRAAADLALARRRYPHTPAVDRLERLVSRSRPLVYDAPEPGRARAELADFVTRRYWRRIAERPVLLVVAALALFGPGLLAGYWGWADPEAARGLAPAGFESVTARDTADFGLTVDEQAAMSSMIFTNNVRVALLAFAGGVFWTLGTVALLLYNGVVLGVVFGLTIDAGNGAALFEFVTAHGVLELSCIVVAGAAGLRLGWALVDPGHRPRGVALRAEAVPAVEILLGTGAWLVVAGIIEGFVSPTGAGLPLVAAVGAGTGIVFWGLVAWRGRIPDPPGRHRGTGVDGSLELPPVTRDLAT